MQMMVVLNCLGSAIGALVIVGDLLPSIIRRVALLANDRAILADTVLLDRRVRWSNPMASMGISISYIETFMHIEYRGRRYGAARQRYKVQPSEHYPARQCERAAARSDCVTYVDHLVSDTDTTSLTCHAPLSSRLLGMPTALDQRGAGGRAPPLPAPHHHGAAVLGPRLGPLHGVRDGRGRRHLLLAGPAGLRQAPPATPTGESQVTACCVAKQERGGGCSVEACSAAA